MPIQSDKYNLLIDRLKAFSDRYYKARIIKGSVVTVLFLLCLWFVILLAEFTLYLPGNVRFAMFLSGIAAPLVAALLLIGPSFFKLIRLGKGLSEEMSASLIAKHFPEIQDKLINVLQLGRLAGPDGDNTLLVAAIDQKTIQIQPFDFLKAIRLLPKRNFLLTAVAVFFLIGGSVVVRPGIVTQSGKRVINYNTAFQPPAPFRFALLSDTLEVFQGRDFMVKTEITGDELPAEVRIVTSKGEFLMKKTGSTADRFEFRLKEVMSDVRFHFEANGITSEEYLLHARVLPSFKSLKITTIFPGYLGRAPETVSGTGDLVVPAGTVIRWLVATGGGGQAVVKSGKDIFDAEGSGDAAFRFKKVALNSFAYSILLLDASNQPIDSMVYTCQVEADQPPSISVVQEGDTTTPDLFFFSGQIRDDHGFSKLIFTAENSDNPAESFSYPVQIENGVPAESFFYNLMIDTMPLRAGQNYQGWFTVFDNNTTTGPSSARSVSFSLRKFTRDELSALSKKMSEASAARLQMLKNQSEHTKETIEDLEYKLKSEKNEEWMDRQKIKELVKQQLESVDEVQQLRKKLQAESALREKLSDTYLDRFEKKQQELMSLMQQVLDEKTLEQLRQMQQMIDSLSNTDLKEKLDDLKKSFEQFEQNLDRNLNLYKELALQKEKAEVAEKLKDMAEEQRKLMNETSDSKEDRQQAKNSQDSLNKAFGDLRRQFDSLDVKSRQMQSDTLPASFRMEESKAANAMNEAGKNLDKGKQSNAKSDQEVAAESLEKMSNQIEEMLQEDEQQSQEESATALRQILQNVVEASFMQEKLIHTADKIVAGDPAYIRLGADQLVLKEGLSAMNDSLRVLANKESSLPPFLFGLFDKIDESLQAVLSNHAGRNRPGINLNQRNALTEINNLALLLSEALSNMQQQANMSMMSSGSCKNSKPSKGGKGKPSLKSLRQAQDELNKQLQQMKQQGKQEGKGQQQMNNRGEQFSRMAMQQSLIRRELESYMKSLEEETGKGSEEMKKIAEEMQQTENELIYQKLDPGTLDRQQKILTRLLESEKAEQEREKEERRESKTGNLEMESNPLENFLYKDAKRTGEDVYLREELKYSPFYQSKVIRFEHNTAN